MIAHNNAVISWSGRLLLAGEMVVVGGAVVASIVREQFLLPALALAAGYWLIRLIASGRLSIRTPADWAIIVLLCTIPITIHISAHPEITNPQVYRLLTGIALYYAIVNWVTSPLRFRLLWAGLGGAGVGLALLSAVSVRWRMGNNPFTFLPAALSERLTEVISDTVNPNVMAGQLVIILPMILTLLLFAVGWRIRWLVVVLGWGFAGVMGGVLVMTQSRGALLALMLATILLLFLRWRERWLRVILSIPIIGVMIYLFGWERILRSILVDRGNPVTDNLEGRIEIWTRAGYILHDFPFTGVGLGNFRETIAVLYPYVRIPTGSGEHAHNIFLQVGADLGLPGLIAWMAILLLIIGAAWRTYQHGKETQNNEAAAAGAGLLVCQVALVVHGMVDAVTWGMIRPAPLVWVLWGLAVASERLLTVPATPPEQPSDSELSDSAIPLPSEQNNGTIQIGV